VKGSKGLYVFTVTDFEDTDCVHVQIGSEEAYIPMRDIYDAASNHKQYLEAKARIDAMPEEERIAKADKEEELSDVLASILRRLDALEAHFTPAGLTILSEHLSRYLRDKLRQQTGVRNVS